MATVKCIKNRRTEKKTGNTLMAKYLLFYWRQNRHELSKEQLGDRPETWQGLQVKLL